MVESCYLLWCSGSSSSRRRLWCWCCWVRLFFRTLWTPRTLRFLVLRGLGRFHTYYNSYFDIVLIAPFVRRALNNPNGINVRTTACRGICKQIKQITNKRDVQNFNALYAFRPVFTDFADRQYCSHTQFSCDLDKAHCSLRWANFHGIACFLRLLLTWCYVIEMVVLL